tara:strand:+ start:1298 stop:1777 length:480 start_codon:yes stop_codon:yes gene_type:complete
MNFDKVKGLVGSLAPTLGSALGGPVGGAAASMLANVLGCDPVPAKIEKALQQATPEQLAEIKKAELDFEVRMKELEVDVFALETKDIQDARRTFAQDWTAKIIAITMVFFFCGYIAMITIMPPEQNSMELINLVLGYMGGLVSAVVSYFFGSSQMRDSK